ncbi:ABC transporter permease [Neisseriaceae bacterium TC5R-5]|nr:ABC transporter permease [Neisseriaceae bacterium TC5R-5]
MRNTSEKPSRLARWTLGSAGLLILLACWWGGTYWLQTRVPLAAALAPDQTFSSLLQLLLSNELTEHVLVSLRRVLIGLLIALAIGVPLGLAVGASRYLEASTGIVFQFLRMISPLSWMPIAVMVLGVGDAPIYFLLAFAAVWPILLNTVAGVRQLDARWMMLGKSLSATRWELLRSIILPGVLGHILTGLRLAIGIVWIVLVPCEMLGVSSGLGYFILDTRDRLAYSELMAVILLIGALGFALDGIARYLSRHWIQR